MAISPSTQYHAEDIFETPDDGNRYEVIDGELYVTPPPVPEHQGASGALFVHIANHLKGKSLGRIYHARIGVVLDGGNAVQPDLVYLSQARLGLISSRGIEGPPDLVVEILSPSTRAVDREVKWRRYAQAGVLNYWIVDPRTRSLEAYRLGNGDFVALTEARPGETFQPELFPGLVIPIDDLWA